MCINSNLLYSRLQRSTHIVCTDWWVFRSMSLMVHMSPSLWCNQWTVSDPSGTAQSRPEETLSNTNRPTDRQNSGSCLFERLCAWELQVMISYECLHNLGLFKYWSVMVNAGCFKILKRAIKTLDKKRDYFAVTGQQVMLVDRVRPKGRSCGLVPKNLSNSRCWRAWWAALTSATWPATPTLISLE